MRAVRASSRAWAATTSSVQSAHRSRQHVGDVGAVAGQAGNLDVQPGAGHRLADATHRRRVAGEPVEGEHAPDVTDGGMGQRLGAGG